MSDDRQTTGRMGENAAAQWYTEHGYVILDRNWRCRSGELDIVCESPEGDVVVFIEVKTRQSNRFGAGVEAVGYAKQRKIRGLALEWLRSADRSYASLRFDVVDADARGHLQVFESCF